MSIGVASTFGGVKPVTRFSIDERHQTADADFANNSFPQQIQQSRIELYKRKRKERNLMADMLVELKQGQGKRSGDGKALPLTDEP